MQTIKFILNYIILTLDRNVTNQEEESECQLITCFDRQFPKAIKQFGFEVPIIFYRGDLKKLIRCIGVVLSEHPSYYIKRVLQHLNSSENLLGINYQSNSISNNLYLCDIIYCNDISTFGNKEGNLYISIDRDLTINQQLQFCLMLISKLMVLEGYPTTSGYQLVNDAIDNNIQVYALPTNIYIKDGSWPNLLISEGITPLLLNENKEEYTCKN